MGSENGQDSLLGVSRRRLRSTTLRRDAFAASQVKDQIAKNIADQTVEHRTEIFRAQIQAYYAKWVPIGSNIRYLSMRMWTTRFARSPCYWQRKASQMWIKPISISVQVHSELMFGGSCSYGLKAVYTWTQT
ncbi:unnamed protein product [Prorocentrum cordatum]|uniref:Uncharacterized protein n=1 Tax=Prorocentrum cordatum TaxID=2364126 RepID=A0ABN9WXV2_9DINO|nr:unnamed protein product [Polarella glacialis]